MNIASQKTTPKRLLVLSTQPLDRRLNGVTIPIVQTLESLGEDVQVLVVAPRASAPAVLPEYRWEHRFIPLQLSFTKKFFRYLFSLTPHIVYRKGDFNAAGLGEIVNEFRPDVVHLDFFDLSEARTLMPSDSRVILSINDSTTLFYQGMITSPHMPILMRLTAIPAYFKMKALERKGVEGFHAVRLVTNRDITFMRGFGAKGNLVCIPNSVDYSSFKFDTNASKGGIIFVGLGGGPTEASLRQLILQLSRRRYSKSFKIVGKGYSDAFITFAANYPFVEICGYVDDLNKEYGNALIFANPIDKPCGLFNKYLEAMSAGAICIGFAQSFGGMLGFKDGVHGVAVRSLEELAERAHALAEEPSPAIEIAKEARAYVEKEFSFNLQRKRLRELYLGEVNV